MIIDWSKQKCFVCNSIGFHKGFSEIHTSSGKIKKISKMICNGCGDSAFSPEQYIAQNPPRKQF